MALIGEMQYLTIDGSTYKIATSNVTVDSAMSSTSENPVQNKVIKSALDNKADVGEDISVFNNDIGYLTSADVPEGASAYTGTILPVSTTASSGSVNGFARGDHVHAISFATTSVGSASAGTAIPADDITAWTTNTPTSVTKKTVVTGGTTTAITPVTSKTVVTSASGATASYSAGTLTLTNGSFDTGASVTTGTAVNAYTSLTTGDSVDVTPGTAASLSYTAKSIPNISVSSKTVVTGLSE